MSDPVIYSVKFPIPKSADELNQYRSAALRAGSYSTALSKEMIDRLTKHITYYPEVQAATICALADDPHPDLVAKMADAVLRIISTPGESPSEADRLMSIHAVTAALQAAADHVTPTPEVPF